MSLRCDACGQPAEVLISNLMCDLCPACDHDLRLEHARYAQAQAANMSRDAMCPVSEVKP